MREFIVTGDRASARSGTHQLVVLLAALALGGCLGGSKSAPSASSAPSIGAASTSPSSSSETGTASGSATNTTAPPAGSTPTGAAQNRAPTITGTPLPALNASSSYSFSPAAGDADGDTLTFSVSNKPSWATFNTLTGQLSGTPTLADVGTHANITITVTDGSQSATLPAFAIAVTQISVGAATLSWSPPTQNTDGTPLTNLSGYRIYYGTSPTAITQSVAIQNAGLTTYVLENLSPATWYFTITAMANGVESERSGVVSKTIS